jgi:hypothetical protein
MIPQGALKPDQLHALLAEHLDRYPDMQAPDLWRLLRQATFGPADIEPLTELIRHQLHADVAALEDPSPLDHEEPVELLSPDAALARVHLRPYLRAGGSLERLALALDRTRRALAPPEIERVGPLLGAARAALPALGAPEALLTSLDELLRELIPAGLPDRAHSDAYAARYQPLYRVVWLEALQGGVQT